MSRKKAVNRKVVKAKDAPPDISEPVADGGGQFLPAGSGSGSDAGESAGNSFDVLWQDLVADFSRMILNAHAADPHRYDDEGIGGIRGAFGLAIALLICGLLIGGAAVFSVSAHPVVW